MVVNVSAKDNASAVLEAIGEENAGSVLKLKVKGTINSYDLMAFRNNMQHIRELDLSEATVVANSYCYYQDLYSKDNIVTSYFIPSTVVSLILPNNVTSLDDNAFNGCYRLTSMTIPNSVTSIGEYAFYGCSGLTSIIIPNSVTSIGWGAFEDCGSLTSVTLHCNTIDSWFAGITSIEEITMGDEVTTIGEYAFYGCSGLTSIIIPKSVTSIGREAFRYCSSLTSIVVENGNSVYDSRNNCNAIIKTSRNTLILGCENTIIPNSVTCIDNSAFGDCTGLTSIIIPSSVNSIGRRAFFGCSGLSSISVEEGNNRFDSRDNCNAIIETSTNTLILGCKNTIISNSVTTIGAYAFEGCSDLTSIIIPNSVTRIGDDAFEGCYGLTSVHISDLAAWSQISFVDGGSNPLSYAHHLYLNDEEVTDLSIPESVTSIGSYAFYGCSSLTSVNIPNSVTSIGGSAFSGCSSLTSVNIPNSVTSIGENAFLGTQWYNNQPNGMVYVGYVAYKYKGKMPSNTSIIIKDGTKGIGDYAFYDCSGLTSVTIPEGVINIGNYAFSSCSNLTSINIPNGVTSIGGWAFLYCSNLTSVTIPKSVTSIGSFAFLHCTNLTSVYISDIAAWCKISFLSTTNVYASNPLYYAHHLFLNGEEVKDLVIPNSVTSIGPWLFYNCSSLTSVIIGNCVTSIGDDAFYNCTGLTSVTIPESVTSIGMSAFYGCTGLTSVTIPESVTRIDIQAFGDCSSLISVKVGMENPPRINVGAFSNRANATLYVPKGCKTAYKRADFWQNFKEIVELWLATSTPTMLTDRGAMMSIDLTNDNDIIMTEFFLQLPEGISIAEDEDGYPDVTINADRGNKHTVEVERTSDGLYHFLCFSTNNNAFEGHDGELLQVKLVSEEGMEGGTYSGTLKSILMADMDRNEITLGNYTFNINVLDLEPGDVNADTKINGMDLVEMVDYIMERPSERFVFAAAELTDDGIVNGMDLVELIELIMAQNVQNAKSTSMRAPAHQDAADLEPCLTRLSTDAIALGVDASEDFILAQCVVELTGGAQLKDITTDSRHQVIWKQVGSNKYLVLAYSTKNTPFQHNDALLTVTCKGEGDIRVSDAMLVDANRQARWLGDKEEGCVTSIDGLMADYGSDAEVYDLQGRKVGQVSSQKNMAKGVYMINGKKVLVK